MEDCTGLKAQRRGISDGERVEYNLIKRILTAKWPRAPGEANISHKRNGEGLQGGKKGSRGKEYIIITALR